jgi:hypothetical protein
MTRTSGPPTGVITHRFAGASPSTYDKASHSVDCVISAGAAVRRVYGTEILRIDSKSVDLSRVSLGTTGRRHWRRPVRLFGVPESMNGHISASRFQNLDIAGATLVEGPDYQGLTWSSGSKRALRGKAAYDGDSSAAHDAVAVRVASSISRFVPGPGESRDGVTDIFSGVQARVIDLMAGGAAEVVFFGDAPPMFMASDVLSATAIAGIVCRSTTSIAAFLEHAFQEALMIIEENKSIVVALAQALIDHPNRTLNSSEIDAVITTALSAKATIDKIERSRRWAGVEKSAADFTAGLESWVRRAAGMPPRLPESGCRLNRSTQHRR